MTCTCAYHDQLIEIRRHLHTMPEEGWSEFTTTAFIVGKLREYGYEVLLGKKVINPDNCLGRNLKVVEAGLKLARENGVSEELLAEMDGLTGCVGVLDTGRPGPVTTLRFDIDCLAIEELFDANKLDQKTLEATFARYNELTQPARTPTSAAASTRKQSRSAKRPSTSPK